MAAPRYLIDTHLFYWWMTEPAKLGEPTATRMREADIAISTATLWEMILKNRKGKLPLPDDPLHEVVVAQGFRLLPITPYHLQILRCFVAPHEDPFDRLLLATAIAEQHTFLTRDGPLLELGLSFVERG